MLGNGSLDHCSILFHGQALHEVQSMLQLYNMTKSGKEMLTLVIDFCCITETNSGSNLGCFDPVLLMFHSKVMIH
jgi:hypothetical protein